MQRVKIDQQAPLNQQVAGDSSHPQRLERNLFCVTSGPLPPNPAELIGSQQMKTLIEDAAALADYVLIDTPPVLVVADALSLMGLVDAVIVCSRINSTTIEEARQVRTLLQRIGAHTLGVVAGGVKASKRRRYDSYGYFISEQQIAQQAGDRRQAEAEERDGSFCCRSAGPVRAAGRQEPPAVAVVRVAALSVASRAVFTWMFSGLRFWASTK